MVKVVQDQTIRARSLQEPLVQVKSHVEMRILIRPKLGRHCTLFNFGDLNEAQLCCISENVSFHAPQRQLKACNAKFVSSIEVRFLLSIAPSSSAAAGDQPCLSYEYSDHKSSAAQTGEVGPKHKVGEGAFRWSVTAAPPSCTPHHACRRT